MAPAASASALFPIPYSLHAIAQYHRIRPQFTLDGGVAADDLVVGVDEAQVDVLVREDHEAPVADADDQLVGLLRPHRHRLDPSVVGLAAPRHRAARLDHHVEPAAAFVRIHHELRAGRLPGLVQPIRGQPHAGEDAASVRPGVVDAATAAALAEVGAPLAVGLAQRLDGQQLAAQAAVAAALSDLAHGNPECSGAGV